MDFLASFLLVVYVSNWSGKSADHSNAVRIVEFTHIRHIKLSPVYKPPSTKTFLVPTHLFIFLFIYCSLICLCKDYVNA